MKSELTWYDVFIENLYERFSKKSDLVEQMMKMLCIEREAVYRRLRKEVLFTAHEVIKIASEWKISLDEIVGINSGLVTFHLQPINYLEPSKKEVLNLQKKVKGLEYLVASENAEYMEVGNKIPRPLSTGFLTLYRLKIFNWAYHYNTKADEMPRPFSKIVIPDKLTQEFEKYSKISKKVATTNFILDLSVFDSIVRGVQYYHSILLIDDEEKELIRKELYELLDYLMDIATKGYYPETQKKVNIYISQLYINTNYCYHDSEDIKSCRVHAFGKYDIVSYNLEMFNNFKTWMNLKKRASIQISEVNERSRIEYFMKQRKLVEGM